MSIIAWKYWAPSGKDVIRVEMSPNEAKKLRQILEVIDLAHAEPLISSLIDALTSVPGGEGST